MASLFASLLDRTTLTANGRFLRAVADEKTQLDRAVDRGQACEPPQQQPHSTQTDSAVWKIHVPNQPPRSMRLVHVPADSDRHVVMVDADKFYRAWLNRPAEVGNPHRMDECLLRADMPKDYKYSGAVTGFDLEAATPVPLAMCHVHQGTDGEPRISFTNGITRTFWLLANNAESFPVMVGNAAEAQVLHRAAGVGPGPQRAAEIHAQSREAAEQQPKPTPPTSPQERGPRGRGPRGL